MKNLTRLRLLFSAVAVAALAGPLFAQTAVEMGPSSIAREFKDPLTGNRILHLSRLPNTGSGVIYFHQECLTPDSRYAVIRYLDIAAGHTAGYMYRWDFQNQDLTKLTERVTRNQVMAPASGNLYYSSDKDHTIYATNIMTKETRQVGVMPAGIVCTGGLTVDKNEELVVGVAEPEAVAATQPTTTRPPNQGPAFGQTFDRHDTNILFSFNIKTGEYKQLHKINTWLGHTQFSPTDPTLIMFCHEGPWAKVDRMWTLKLGAAEPEVLFKRAIPGEIAGHESFSRDGQTVWFDHDFKDPAKRHFLTGKNLKTGELTNYKITPDFGSIHYVQSPDMKFFVSDGGARKDAPATQAMYILIPNGDGLKAIKLCSMEKNNYKDAEPNPHITPDQHWVLFTATFSGTPQAYAVEMPKEYWR